MRVAIYFSDGSERTISMMMSIFLINRLSYTRGSSRLVTVKIFPRKITIILKNTFNKQLPIKNYLLDRDSNL